MYHLFTVAQVLSDKNLPGHGGTNATEGTIKDVLQIVYVTLGALSVVLLIVAGLRYMTAQGEPTKVTQAKNAILYALIGLVIAAMAAVIVNFVIGRL
jgi:hypothetical protein